MHLHTAHTGTQHNCNRQQARALTRMLCDLCVGSTSISLNRSAAAAVADAADDDGVDDDALTDWRGCEGAGPVENRPEPGRCKQMTGEKNVTRAGWGGSMGVSM